jgi:hypothetical protein
MSSMLSSRGKSLRTVVPSSLWCVHWAHLRLHLSIFLSYPTLDGHSAEVVPSVELILVGKGTPGLPDPRSHSSDQLN